MVIYVLQVGNHKKVDIKMNSYILMGHSSIRVYFFRGLGETFPLTLRLRVLIAPHHSLS